MVSFHPDPAGPSAASIRPSLRVAAGGSAASLLLLLAAALPAVSSPNLREHLTVRIGDQASHQTRHETSDPGSTSALFGSGVLIARPTAATVAIVTTDHVLLDRRPFVCVQFFDNSWTPAAIVRPPQQGKDLDVVFLLARVGKERHYPLATRHQGPIQPGQAVRATGFPAGAGYTEAEGRIQGVLSTPLMGGYSLVYSSDVSKGMSGGGVFSGSDALLAINAMHADPLWAGDLIDQRGRPLAGPQARELEDYALGVGIASVERALRGVAASRWRQAAASLSSDRAPRCRAVGGGARGNDQPSP